MIEIKTQILRTTKSYKMFPLKLWKELLDYLDLMGAGKSTLIDILTGLTGWIAARFY